MSDAEFKQPAKLLDNWKDVSTVKRGRMAGTRGYFIMKNGKLADASFEMEGSTGLGGGVDHYGYALALDNRELFGISDELAAQAAKSDNFDIYRQVWSAIEQSILARVMILPMAANTKMPSLTIQMFRETNGNRALKLAQTWAGKQIPDAPENSGVTIEYGNDFIHMDTMQEFLGAHSIRDVRINKYQ